MGGSPKRCTSCTWDWDGLYFDTLFGKNLKGLNAVGISSERLVGIHNTHCVGFEFKQLLSKIWGKTSVQKSTLYFRVGMSGYTFMLMYLVPYNHASNPYYTPMLIVPIDVVFILSIFYEYGYLVRLGIFYIHFEWLKKLWSLRFPS